MAIKGRLNVTWNGAGDSVFTVGIREGTVLDVALPAAQLLARGPGAGGRYDDWMFRDYWTSAVTPIALATNHSAYSEMYGPLNVRSRRKLDELNSTLLLWMDSAVGNVNIPRLYFSLDVLLALP
jgi:hypothetical protein